ncbi:MAG TPA: sugar phosphate isomerase/epimerase family protein [Nocardioidaceae bacterium]|nr:sugar phosphate isomerase/epimerase family protein [Nocardioidaceae bacterium]
MTRKRAEQRALVALSSSSVYPEPVSAAFEISGRLGYDAVEIMVSIDPVSQDIDAVKHLQEYHGIPVCAVHAPCLLITQRVWGTDPWGKLEMSAEMAHEVGADVVVVHPPFRWQRDYARGFAEGIELLEERTGIAFAIENMYPWRASSKREMQMYLPSWDLTDQDYVNTTLDVSHASTARQSSLELAQALGDTLRHVHLTDGTGSAKDEHLIPGRGTQPVAELLEYLADQSFGGHIVLEVNTRRAGGREARELELMEALAFTRLHFEKPRV